jgi:sugar phosphate permease
MSTPTPLVRTTAAKAWIAAVGGTLTALTTALATAAVVLDDDRLDVSEVTAVTLALVTLASTVWGVWAARNKPKTAGQSDVKTLDG